MEQNLTFDELIDLFYDNPKVEIKVKNTCEIIVEAETNWRTSPETVVAFIDEIENMIKNKSTLENVRQLIHKYESFAMSYAWELESLTIILDVFDYDKSKTLREIFSSIYRELNKNTIC